MISNSCASNILNFICGVKDNMTIPEKVYLGLCSEMPSSAGAITGEPYTNPNVIDENGQAKTTTYARVLVSGTEMQPKRFGLASNGKISNSEEIQFKACRKVPFGKMNYFFLSTSQAGGSAFLWGELIKKDEDGKIITDEKGNPVIGVDVEAETVPVFYEGELQASIDVPLNEEEATE